MQSGGKIPLNKTSTYVSKIMYEVNKHDKGGDYFLKNGFLAIGQYYNLSLKVSK